MMAQDQAMGEPLSKRCLEKPCDIRSLLLRETTKSEVLEKQIERLKSEVQNYQIAIESLLSGIRTSIQPSHTSLLILKERLEKIDNVLSLHYSLREGVIYLWILEEREDIESELAVTQELSDLFSTFSDLRFDFLIIPLEGLKAEEMLPSTAKEVFSK
jgi:hypothetical protein